MNEEQWLPLRALVISQFPLHREWSAHAPDHWERAERYGILLCSRTGADLLVVRLFALFHDSRRMDECVLSSPARLCRGRPLCLP